MNTTANHLPPSLLSGQVVKAARDITAGIFNEVVLCKEGTLLKITGPSTNPDFPIGVAKVDDATWLLGVTEEDIAPHV